MQTKFYWFFERNVKSFLVNEDNVFENWISVGKELNIFGPFSTVPVKYGSAGKNFIFNLGK